MRYLKTFYFLIGVGLLAVILYRTDLADVAAHVSLIGWWAILVILAVFFAVFLLDSLTWLMALPALPVNGKWLYRMWRVRLVGEAFNSVMPAAGMGGEPIKAILLKRHYGVGYPEGTASIVLGRTINMIALIFFLATGFALMLASPDLAAPFKLAGGLGLLGFGAATAILFGIQWLKLSSRVGDWLSHWRAGRGLAATLHHVRDVEDRFIQFYTGHRSRFSIAVLLSVLQWFLGMLEVYYALAFLGHPVSLTDALIIEAVAQLIRAGTFFIPANLGAQEGAFVITCTAITGSPTLGLATALIRRFRELVWIVWGFGQGFVFSLAARRQGGQRHQHVAPRRVDFIHSFPPPKKADTTHS